MGDGVNIAARLEGICAARRDLSLRGRLSAGQGATRSQGQRSRSDPTQEHRRAGPGLFARSRPACASEAAAATPKKRSALTPGRRRDRGIAHSARRRSLVFLRREPACARRLERASAASRLQRLSIVVPPFANLSGDPAQDYLADALTDELTTALARIHDSFVIARNTAFTYKGKPVDAKAIGKDLGVRYVLEGSVQPSGNQVQGQRPAHRRRQRRAPLGRSIRHPPRRSVADAGRDRHPSGARDGYSTPRGRGRPTQTDARGKPRRRRFGSPVRGGRAESRIYRQGSGCGLPSLRAGARSPIPTMSAP